MDTTELEARKLAHAERQLEADIELRKAEMALKREDLERAHAAEVRRPIWNTAAGLAILGGLITFLTAIVSNYLQSKAASRQREEEHRAQLVLERQKFQATLIQHAIERPETIEGAAVNLNFLWEAGLIPDYKDIPKIVKSSGALTSESPVLPSGATFGSGDRTPVQNTKAPAYSAVCHLEITAADGKKYSSTGVLVSPRLVITAGYVVYMHHSGGYVKSIRVRPGRNGSEEPFGEYTSSRFNVPLGWIDDENPEDNYGAIFLDSDVGGVAPLQVREVADSAALQTPIILAGYPGDKSEGTLWQSAGRLERVTETTVGYSLYSTGGSAGSPIMGAMDGVPQGLIGIHVSRGEGIRLNGERLEQLEKWKAEAQRDAE